MVINIGEHICDPLEEKMLYSKVNVIGQRSSKILKLRNPLFVSKVSSILCDVGIHLASLDGTIVKNSKNFPIFLLMPTHTQLLQFCPFLHVYFLTSKSCIAALEPKQKLILVSEELKKFAPHPLAASDFPVEGHISIVCNNCY